MLSKIKRKVLALKQKIFLIIFGLFISFIIVELVLHLAGGVIGFIQEYRNKQSLKQKDCYRILCLGGSTTSNQYPAYLEQILNQRNLGVRFSVIDKGLPGADTSRILAQLDYNIKKYRPDMIIAMMGINDRGIRLPFEDAKFYKWVYFLKTYRVFNWIYQSIENRLIPGFLNRLKDEGYSGLDEQDGGLLEAQEELKKAVEQNPLNGQGYLALGKFYRDQDRVFDAEYYFKKAIEINDKNDIAYFELGWLYLGQGKDLLTEQLFKKAIEINPNNEVGYLKLGVFHRMKGSVGEAKYFLEKALKINPRNDRIYEELWLLYKQIGQDYRIIESLLKKAIANNPLNDRAYGAISVLYKDIGKYELAEKCAQKARQLRLKYYRPGTVNNYFKLKDTADRLGIKLVCMQYPVRRVERLKKIFRGKDGIIFVDNELIFKEGIQKEGYKQYFTDMFGGDFGHCTQKGNKLLAENIANTIIKELFN